MMKANQHHLFQGLIQIVFNANRFAISNFCGACIDVRIKMQNKANI